MIRPTAKNVEALKDFMLRIEFDNGERRCFDVKPYIQGSWYGELGEPCYFKRVFANGYTVEWPNGQDLCPDEIYHNSRIENSAVTLD